MAAEAAAAPARDSGLDVSLQGLHISEVEHAPTLEEQAITQSNPWEDDGADRPNDHAVATSTPFGLREPAAGISAEHAFKDEESKPRVSEEVLTQFDPLAASHEEKAAREAWAHAESRPSPPAPAPIPVPSPEPESPKPASGSNTPESPSSPFSPAFPSLAALARTFALPLPRTRPRSLDTAVSVPSPSTLSSFASQQQKRPLPATEERGDESASSSGSEAPRSGRGEERDKEKEKDPPFDFQKFLDQMKMKGAEPVAKYLRSFLSNFAKRTFTVNDQVKIIQDFLGFISGRMRECEVWRNVSDAEFDNAMEGMEKLVMNRLYVFTFTPAVARAVPPRPVTTDDLERDRVLAQRIALFGWIEEKHLDVPEGEGSKGFLMFAQQELLKINHYKAPRDKLICILNCCKVIFGLLRHLHMEESADSFLPILIYVVLKANPEHLLSNVEFINRFRNPAKLQSEAGYYLSSLMGAVSFIETMDHTSLSNITQEEFERNVEEAIQALPHTPDPSEPTTPRDSNEKGHPGPPLSPHLGEEAAQPLSLPGPGTTLSEDAKRLLQKTGDAVSKPLNAISRIFNEALDSADGKLSYLPGPFAPLELGRERQQHLDWGSQGSAQEYTPPHTPAGQGAGNAQTLQTPYKPRVRRVPSPLSSQSMSSPGFAEHTPTRNAPWTHQPLAMGPSQSLPAVYQHPQPSPRMQALAQSESEGAHVSRTPTPNLDLAGIQAEIDQAHERAATAARETLVQIFPSTDREIIDWVLEANQGDLGKSIEALLEMSSGT
ncbi:hypothetical protein GLOTRDRAFT_74843 [Gloeophyllum trabeum ATCC 11539]|uniref:VPS9 domain-containing protein n=1 Tax=Gloeophyllum trabeum (strain ATCC 11539 / FP-39264 / Madison 617) TaxID=670483 RepID=S7RP05_GLOTA|nr:uncharacterized protein GLOTRDRAFT_74843 [Gloeophyllum trabeum ATCC 11539]EPQ56270.1 hypothetical protein GLOTRDRAFT_74843 [Gloeophyllum trabeum ATCC 11539]